MRSFAGARAGHGFLCDAQDSRDAISGITPTVTSHAAWYDAEAMGRRAAGDLEHRALPPPLKRVQRGPQSIKVYDNRLISSATVDDRMRQSVSHQRSALPVPDLLPI